MAEKKMCPHCGGQMFMVKIARAGIAETTDDGYKILKESQDKFDIEIIGCARCRQSITEADLVEGVKCSACGKVVTPTDVNSEGICNVCEAIKQREELANASREDLIKMLLAAEKKTNPVIAKVEKQIAKAEDVEDSTANTTEDTAEDTTEETVEANVPEKKSRTKSRKRKVEAVEESTDTNAATVEETPAEETSVEEPVAEETVAEETVVEETVAEEAPVEAVEDIANQQEAPFPTVEVDIPEVSEQTMVPDTTLVAEESSSDEQAIGTGFQMFDDSEEAF